MKMLSGHGANLYIFISHIMMLKVHTYASLIPPTASFELSAKCKRLCILFKSLVAVGGKLSTTFYADTHTEYSVVLAGTSIYWNDYNNSEYALESLGNSDRRISLLLTNFYVDLMTTMLQHLCADLKLGYHLLCDSKYDLSHQISLVKSLIGHETPTWLFSGFTFYLSPEVAADRLIFAIASKGGNVVMGSSSTSTTPGITHEVTTKHHHLRFDRIYVSPDWVYDFVSTDED